MASGGTRGPGFISLDIFSLCVLPPLLHTSQNSAHISWFRAFVISVFAINRDQYRFIPYKLKRLQGAPIWLNKFTQRWTFCREEKQRLNARSRNRYGSSIKLAQKAHDKDSAIISFSELYTENKKTQIGTFVLLAIHRKLVLTQDYCFPCFCVFCLFVFKGTKTWKRHNITVVTRDFSVWPKKHKCFLVSVCFHCTNSTILFAVPNITISFSTLLPCILEQHGAGGYSLWQLTPFVYLW